VELSFRPTVLSDSTIQLHTRVSLSAPDQSFSLRTGGTSTFAFKRRSSDTTVRLKDGQSFAVAGLLKDELSKVTASVPGLASVPIIGMFFKSKRFERQETELVVVVTARLVDPLEESQLPPLPGHDGPTDPTDLQMFLLNIDNPQAKPKANTPAKRRRPSGKLGFSR
jgi:pilus assembly protein CpaC